MLVVRRPIDEIPSAVHAVRTAFLTAALAGLALTLILAIPLAGRIVAPAAPPARGGSADGPGGPVRRGRGRPRARRGRRPGPHVCADAAAPPAAGGGAQGVRGDGVARAAHAADLAGGDARDARRGPSGRRHRSRRRAGAAGQRSGSVPAAGAARRRPARSQPPRRTGGPAVRAGRALRAQPRGDRGVRAGNRRAQDRLRARRLVRSRVGAGRSRQRRADPADPARQRRAGQPGRRRDQDPDAQRAGCVAQRLRPGSGGHASRSAS